MLLNALKLLVLGAVVVGATVLAVLVVSDPSIWPQTPWWFGLLRVPLLLLLLPVVIGFVDWLFTLD